GRQNAAPLNDCRAGRPHHGAARVVAAGSALGAMGRIVFLLQGIAERTTHPDHRLREARTGSGTAEYLRAGARQRPAAPRNTLARVLPLWGFHTARALFF